MLTFTWFGKTLQCCIPQFRPSIVPIRNPPQVHSKQNTAANYIGFYCYFGGPKCLPHSGHYFVHIWCLVNCSSLLGRQHIQLWNNSLLSESPLAQDVFYQKVKNYFKNITSSAYQTHTVAFFHQICMCSAKKNLSTINTNERTSCYKGKTWVDILCFKSITALAFVQQ